MEYYQNKNIYKKKGVRETERGVSILWARFTTTAHLTVHFKYIFEHFKYTYTFFYIFFYLYVYQKHLNNITQTFLPNIPLVSNFTSWKLNSFSGLFNSFLEFCFNGKCHYYFLTAKKQSMVSNMAACWSWSSWE